MNIRGIKDLLGDGSGILVNNLDEMIDKIIEIKHSDYKVSNTSIDEYKLENVEAEIKDIINNYFVSKLK